MKRIILHLVIIFVIIGLSGFVRSELFSESEKVLARVGDKVITQSDLDELMKTYEPFAKNPYTLQEKKEFLNMLIKGSLIVTEAEKEKMDEKPEFKLKLKMYKNQLLTREYIASKIEAFITVKEEEVEEILKRNPNLVPRETLTIKEILVKTEKEAEEVYQDLEKGADFSKIASEKSISRTKTAGGLVGTISKGQLPPSLETVVFNLKERDLVSRLKRRRAFGYTIW